MTPPLTVHGVPVIDIDSHYTEPPDLWTSRAPASYKERVPRVIRDEEGRERWVVDGDVDFGPMGFTVVKKDGEKAYGMMSLTDFDEMSDAASYPEPRLDLLDRLGISQQIIYPNVAGFGSHRFMSLEDSELRNICSRVYNDAIIELQQAGNGRLFPQALTPFWDMDECVREIRRVTDAGITGITMTDTPEAFELPHLHDPHWDPLWSTCQELGIPVNFHVGSGNNLGGQMIWDGYGPQRFLATISVSLFMVQCKTIMNLIFSGLLDRYPNLNFVSVESG
ncbi:MAG: amidohydrolase family protein, partial [Dehalococcoidia bacterium]|nr:amidohydrolase family protein [Dehalococcoidia bacterium]